MSRTKWLWILWGGLSLMLVGYLGYRMLGSDAQVYTPGPMTHAHHQIELACASCHTKPFGGATVIQNACVKCHGEELKQADDSHPKSKFTDPRNAARVAKLDATHCVSCHTEHRPEITHAMGVTLPDDYCQYCHDDIAKDRPSHAGMAFDTCASSGCHNFHDNRALYEDFIAKHLDEPALLPNGLSPQLSTPATWSKLINYPLNQYPLQPVREPDSAQHTSHTDAAIVSEWQTSGHAQSGVNCTACHLVKDSATQALHWVDKPDHTACKTCHRTEVDGFLSGLHGMRLANGLPAMTPAQADLPMQDKARHKTLGCASCHTDHRFDTRHAATQACLGCHADKHSLAYKTSPHALQTHGANNNRMSCASCHLPRLVVQLDQGNATLVQHNQNANLRPNEKMVREVCMNCHGYGFSIDALSDRELIQRNFSGQPAHTINSIEMVRERLKHKKTKSSQGGDIMK